MIFQGTVFGPTLWNTFYEDARLALNECFFKEIVYADDLNGFCIFSGEWSNSAIHRSMDTCQHELHEWGRANQVEFDPGKESKHVLSLTQPEGSEFTLLGVAFDCDLGMITAIDDLVTAANWKMRTLLRTRRFYTNAEMVVLYKTNLLSYLEYRTPAIYHARRELLTRLDNVQKRFLRDAGVTDMEALMEFNLAPLETRRDMAMLGMLHRTVLGKGPPHFKEFFQSQASAGQRHRFHLRDVARSRVSKRCALGLIPVYNMLPSEVVETFSVKEFQANLQELVKSRAVAGCRDWQSTFSPRLAMDAHPLC